MAAAIFDSSLTPNVSIKSGNSAVAGRERKKSTRNSTLRYIFFELPSKRPAGRPINTEIMKATATLIRVANMSGQNALVVNSEHNFAIVLTGPGNKKLSVSPMLDIALQNAKIRIGPASGISFLVWQNFIGFCWRIGEHYNFIRDGKNFFNVMRHN